MIDVADTLPASDRVRLEGIADALGSPLPPGWWQSEAVQARRDRLAAVAGLTAAALAAILPYRGTPEWDAALRLFSYEMVALDDAMRDYTGMTQRGDVLDVVRGALAAAVGDAMADLVVGMLRRVRGD